MTTTLNIEEMPDPRLKKGVKRLRKLNEWLEQNPKFYVSWTGKSVQLFYWSDDKID